MNNASGNNSLRLANYEDLHFCSQRCLHDFLFKPANNHYYTLIAALEKEMQSECYKDDDCASYSKFEALIELIKTKRN